MPLPCGRLAEVQGAGVSEVLLSHDPADGVRVLTLHRPERRNALNQILLHELSDAMDAAAASASVRAVVLAGDRLAFCAGADIREMQQTDAAGIGSRTAESLWRKVEAFEKPLLAAVAGVAFGGGLELALLCDLIILGENARLALPEVKIGAMPGGGGTQRLHRAVGKTLATMMLLTGDEIDAQTAVRSGLAVKTVATDAVVDEAVRLASRIAANAPLAVRSAKAALVAANCMHLAEGLALERALHDKVFASADRREGMAAFLQKRPARFQGC